MKPVYAQVAAVGLVLLGVAFSSGWYLGEGHVPVVAQVSGLINTTSDAYSERPGQEPVDFMPYWRVWNTLEAKFIPFATTTEETVPAEDRLYNSIEGLVASYGDPYTVFMRPQVSKDFKIATKGSLEGIGAIIAETEGGIVVVQPLAGSPAEKAGLVQGDFILSIDGFDTKGVPVDQAVQRIRGEGGTEVALHIRGVDGTERDVAIVRGTIDIPSTAHAVVKREVPTVAIAPDGTTSTSSTDTEEQDFYILRLFSFSQSSVAAFERELRAYADSGADSLIIDLRGNPGGYLEAAVSMAGWFLPEGTTVVREYVGPEKKERTHETKGQSLFATTPKLAILVDKGSASAAEILAGALQEKGAAKLIGENTFGKGSVQELIDITDELALKVTIARWYTPNGVSISNGGLTPDIHVDASSATSTDPYIEAAITYLSS